MLPNCPYCKRGKLMKWASRKTNKGVTQQYKCNKCGKYNHQNMITNLAARILLLDIETASMEVDVFDLRPDYISPDDIIKDWSILCWNAKWLFDTESIGAVVTPQDAYDRQDAKILDKLWKLLDEADIIIHQNGKKFDIPRINTRFLLAGYPPPSHYLHVDTYEALKKQFGFTSNGMDYVNVVLGIDGKSKMTKEDWRKCVRGSIKDRKSALQKMYEYNKRDVGILEEMYLRIRPWIPAHANLGIYVDTDKDCCPNCQSTELRWGDTYRTPLGLYEAFRCASCGAIGRSTKKKYRIKSVDVRG